MHVVRKTDASGRNCERCDKNGFPQEEKREQASPGARIERLAKVDVRATGTWHGCTKLGVHHAIANRKDRAEKPAKNRLGSTHR